MMNENDYRNTIEYAREEGLAVGLAEGREAGLAFGKARVAKKMLAAGEPLEKIIEFTGLTAQQLEDLR